MPLAMLIVGIICGMFISKDLIEDKLATHEPFVVASGVYSCEKAPE